MKYLLLFLLFVCTSALTTLNVKECKEETYGPMELNVCDEINPYNKYEFTDAVGRNRVTVGEDKYYHNHGYYTAYSRKKKMYIGKRLYDKKHWLKLRESLK